MYQHTDIDHYLAIWLSVLESKNFRQVGKATVDVWIRVPQLNGPCNCGGNRTNASNADYRDKRGFITWLQGVASQEGNVRVLKAIKEDSLGYNDHFFDIRPLLSNKLIDKTSATIDTARRSLGLPTSRQHMPNRVVPRPILTPECWGCRMVFKTRAQLFKHIQQHIGMRIALSQTVEKGFIYEVHELGYGSHSGVELEPNRCLACKTAFDTKANLRNHLNHQKHWLRLGTRA